MLSQLSYPPFQSMKPLSSPSWRKTAKGGNIANSLGYVNPEALPKN